MRTLANVTLQQVGIVTFARDDRVCSDGSKK